MPVGSLLIIDGPQTGKSFDLSAGVVSLGCGQASSIQVADAEIEPTHAELHLRERVCVIRDIAGESGVFVNGSRVDFSVLESGDVVKLGGTTFLFNVETPVRHSEGGLISDGADGSEAKNASGDSPVWSPEGRAEVGLAMESLSHHIRNILQGLNGGAHMVGCGLKAGDGDLVNNGWQMVQRNQDNLSGLLMDLLAHGKSRDPNLKLTDLNQLLSHVVKSLERRANERNVVVKTQFSKSPIKIQLDPSLLERAFHNLLLAAINTCLENQSGVVEIGAEASEKTVQVTIVNNGIGVSLVEFDRMFDPDFCNENMNLLGIGLAVSKRSIQKHEGSVSAKVTPEGEVVFGVTLPV